MNYKTPRRSDQDIIDIYVLGAGSFGIDHAERCHEGRVSVFELPAENPRLARELTESDPPVRLHPYQAHMIAHIIRDDGLLVIRVLRGRQDRERYL